MLKATGICVRRARRTVIDAVSFEAEKGEIVAIVGPNGAGKTSLLEAVCGLLPRAGIVSVEGRPLASFSEHARAFAWMPDETMPAEELTVEDAWAHAVRHATEPRHGVRSALGIDGWMKASLAHLSRGERKRVELALALCRGRPMTLLDEPFAAFDPIQLDTIADVVREHATIGPIVASIHQLDVAERIADRILLIAEGRAIGFGTLQTLREKTDATSLEGVMRSLLAHHAA